MESKTFAALKWIVGILDTNCISYRIGGGTATYIYGSGRNINDIDISMSGKDFQKLLPLVEGFVVAGPKHYKNEKWDCLTLSLNYHGQDIDLTDADSLLMRSKDDTKWIQNRLIYSKYPDVKIDFEGLEVSLMHPKVLLEYKQELAGAHQDFDIDFLNRFIVKSDINI